MLAHAIATPPPPHLLRHRPHARRIHAITTTLRCLAEAVQGSGVNSKVVTSGPVPAGEQVLIRMTESQRTSYLTMRRQQLVGPCALCVCHQVLLS